MQINLNKKSNFYPFNVVERPWNNANYYLC